MMMIKVTECGRQKWKVETLSIQRCALRKFQLSVLIVTASCWLA